LANYLYLLIGISLLLSTCVSGSKNKMGSLCSNLSFSNKKSEASYIDGSRSANVSYPNFSGEKDDFFFLFSGFTDAEGNFLITIDRSFVKFRFKISLHIDDIEALNIIKSKLNVGRVTVEINRDRCSFIVEKYDDIRNVICPLFKSYPLHTSKKLYFEYFNEAVLIKDYINKNLSDAEMERIISLKKGMNSNRETFTYQTSKSQIIINPNWFIGFLEGEGTFGIKTGSTLYFQVAQKNTSQESLNAITTFLIELPSVLPNSKILPMNVVSTINAKTGVVSLVVNSVDSLYYCVLPYLESSNMYTLPFFDINRIIYLLKSIDNWPMSKAITSMGINILFLGDTNLDPNITLYSICAIRVYSNADTQKLEILAENLDKSGVYRWNNLINGKAYIGSSIHLKIRFSQYFNVNYLERNSGMHICRGLLKNGYSNFSLEILEYCDPAKCLEREKFYIDIFKPEYNISQYPSSPFLGLSHSKESIEKMRVNTQGILKTEQHKLSLSLADPSMVSIEVTDLTNDKVTVYPSMRGAAKDLGIGVSIINNFITREQKKPYKGRYIFKFFLL